MITRATTEATPVALTAPAFADDTGDAQDWIQDEAITSITVPAATGNPIPTYAVVGSLPAGVLFNTGTRVISGTPTAVSSGTITIRATNSEGDDDWTVDYATTSAGLIICNGYAASSVWASAGSTSTYFAGLFLWPSRLDLGTSLSEDGSTTLYLGDLQIPRTSTGSTFQIRLAPDLTTQDFLAGPDFSTTMENGGTVIFVASNSDSVTITGPNNTGIS